MTSKSEKDKTKQLQDKCQSVLNGLLRDEDNKYCVDCDSKGPRWASWNIGVFLCIRCAGIHRNLGVHISKVKSVNLDTWTPEQVVSLQQMGNSRARAVYEANLPDNFRRPQSDSSLESFVRAKYEHKKYIAREWVPPALPKVNWEKEIDEEIEKQKRKKKTQVEKRIAGGSVEVPQLPKPKNPSPKPNRINNAPIINEAKKDGDLLGMQQQNGSEDGFGGFLSASVGSTAPPVKENKMAEPDLVKSEEESFFNQTAPTEKEKVKLTKDSILALYSNAPVNNFSQFQAQPQSNPYQPQQQQQQGQQQANFGNFQAFGGFPQQNSFQAPAPQQFNNLQWGANSAQFGAQVPQQMQVNQFPNQFGAQFPQLGATNQFAFAPQQQQAQLSQAQNSGTPNPFFGNQNGSLQQQFGNLGLNNQTGANQAKPLASNIWQ